ncbi:hypothetical protein D9758_010733 [Tetrapyrgos nigripes]|uniref:Uncharacterized protein n=1 Tax=Tetrapyrgos nigripes TaxID=182062 RepID=A0A8H5D6A4_9AGAR|nr:hypothetical protein D9758_010733 [Tetrapyrgos nigripes]
MADSATEIETSPIWPRWCRICRTTVDRSHRTQHPGIIDALADPSSDSEVDYGNTPTKKKNGLKRAASDSEMDDTYKKTKISVVLRIGRQLGRHGDQRTVKDGPKGHLQAS